MDNLVKKNNPFFRIKKVGLMNQKKSKKQNLIPKSTKSISVGAWFIKPTLLILMNKF
jgi:hypothetical protein